MASATPLSSAATSPAAGGKRKANTAVVADRADRIVGAMLTEWMEAVKGLFALAEYRPGSRAHRSSTLAVEHFRRLRALTRIDLLCTLRVRRVLRTEAMNTVLESLLDALTSPNPGGEPRNFEARRQLLFFCNSLHNHLMTTPPPSAAVPLVRVASLVLVPAATSSRTLSLRLSHSSG